MGIAQSNGTMFFITQHQIMNCDNHIINKMSKPIKQVYNNLLLFENGQIYNITTNKINTTVADVIASKAGDIYYTNNNLLYKNNNAVLINNFPLQIKAICI